MKRVTIFQQGCPSNGKAIGVEDSDTLEDVLNTVSQKFDIEAKGLYTAQGGLVEDVRLIRDDDILYASVTETFTPMSPKRKPDDVSAKPSTTRHRLRSIHTSNEWITLNVGGKYFTTTLSTLQRESASMLSRMFSDGDSHTWSSCVDSNGAYLMDRSPVYFEPILNYLRNGELILDKHISPKGVLEEARYFGIVSLVEILEAKIRDDEPPTDVSPINRRDFILRLMSTPANCELRCQGVNFSGANLSKLDLRYINFKYAVMRGTDLSGTTLQYCNFERADLSGANFDGANLLGVKMLCVNLEGASMAGCNFEDPAGCRANLEGANLKYVNLEGSHMAGVNLRVATVRRANLQNCDLRGAVLAGADLEDADLTRSDLQEANLRGANLKGASLELMVNPLHMSQTITQGR
jgi:hypothetical protein